MEQVPTWYGGFQKSPPRSWSSSQQEPGLGSAEGRELGGTLSSRPCQVAMATHRPSLAGWAPKQAGGAPGPGEAGTGRVPPAHGTEPAFVGGGGVGLRVCTQSSPFSSASSPQQANATVLVSLLCLEMNPPPRPPAPPQQLWCGAGWGQAGWAGPAPVQAGVTTPRGWVRRHGRPRRRQPHHLLGVTPGPSRQLRAPHAVRTEPGPR